MTDHVKEPVQLLETQEAIAVLVEVVENALQVSAAEGGHCKAKGQFEVVLMNVAFEKNRVYIGEGTLIIPYGNVQGMTCKPETNKKTKRNLKAFYFSLATDLEKFPAGFSSEN